MALVNTNVVPIFCKINPEFEEMRTELVAVYSDMGAARAALENLKESCEQYSAARFYLGPQMALNSVDVEAYVEELSITMEMD